MQSISKQITSLFHIKKLTICIYIRIVSFSTKTTIWFNFNKHPTGAAGCLISYNLKSFFFNLNHSQGLRII